MKKGFTLVELSIVLVIIGLLVGGILVGQSLINSAQLNAAVRQFAQYDAVVFSFKSKFRQIPGDSWLTSKVAVCCGQDASRDGIITDNDRINNTLRYAAAGSEEYMLFWLELAALSSLKIENCTNLLTRGDAFLGGNGIRLSGNNCNFPEVKYGSGSATTVIAASVDTDNNPIYTNNSAGNALYVLDNCIVASGGTPNLTCTPAFNQTEALAFDAKVDDGIPITGDVLAFSDLSITSVRYNDKIKPAVYDTTLPTKLSLLRKFPKGL